MNWPRSSGEGLSQVSYHVKVLKDYRCIELVKTEPQRGAVEHYYRATSRPYLVNRDWQALPASVRPGMSADFLQMVIDDATAALEEGTFDQRGDRHTSRTPVILDQEGWENLTELLDEYLEQVIKIQAESRARLSKSDEEEITATVAMLAFEVPASRRSSGRADGGQGSKKAKSTKAPQGSKEPSRNKMKD